MTLDPSDRFATALQSDGPAMPEPAQLFAPFIGSWGLVVRWFDEHGAVSRTEAGEWHFAWVLEGRAVQDVWIVPPRAVRTADAALYEYGTSIRFYDPALDAWQSTWIGPMHRMVRTFVARRRGAAVVLETTPDMSPAMRWSFTDITAAAFTWTNEVEEAGRWRVQQTFEARRQVV
jgi:hypothetical protein